MKRITIIVILFVIFMPGILRAAEMNVGLVGWYSFYDSSAFEEGMRGQADNNRSYDDSFSITPALMLGPSLSVSFLEGWSVNFVFLGSLAYRAESEYMMVNPPFPDTPARTEVDLHRYDFDLSVSYTINEYLGVFTGLKYIYGYSEGTWSNRNDSTYDVDNDNEGHWFGPAMGVRIIFPLTESFSLSALISGIFLSNWTRQESFYHNTGITKIEKNQIFSGGYNCYAGINYYIEAFSTVVTAGMRYQDIFYEDGSREQIYGPMLTVAYSF